MWYCFHSADGLMSAARTSSPRASSAFTRCPPTNPPAPVTSAVIRNHPPLSRRGRYPGHRAQPPGVPDRAHVGGPGAVVAAVPDPGQVHGLVLCPVRVPLVVGGIPGRLPGIGVDVLDDRLRHVG